MDTSSAQTPNPTPSPLPPRPGQDPLSPRQWAILLSIADTIIPSICPESETASNFQQSLPDEEFDLVVQDIRSTVANPPEEALVRGYLGENASSVPEFQELLRRTISSYTRASARRGLGRLLDILSNRVGCLILTGKAIAFDQQPSWSQRSAIISWQNSYLPFLREASKVLSSLVKNTWLKTSTTIPQITGCPKVPHQVRHGLDIDYEFLKFSSGIGTHVIDIDVVVVGSGCCGGLTAKNLAEAGHSVLTVEKSYYHPLSSLPMTELEGTTHLFENGGFISSEDNSIYVVAGSNWGGGGTVNWSASLQTQHFVRREWSERHGLRIFHSEEFQDCLDNVCRYMGVSADHIQHNHGNERLQEGSRKLGLSAKPIPQNTAGDVHSCGHCTLGCPSGAKQGPATKSLRDAANAGAKFVEGFFAERVVGNTFN